MVATPPTSTPDRNVTPSSSNAAFTATAASSSPFESSLDRCNTVTSLPNAANAWAISSATMPAPNTTIRFGRICKLNKSKLVVYGASANPTMFDGTLGRPPVATTALRNFNVGLDASPSDLPCSTTSIVVGEVNTPRPWKVCVPREEPRSCPSTGAIFERSFLIRCMMRGKSTSTSTSTSSIGDSRVSSLLLPASSSSLILFGRNDTPYSLSNLATFFASRINLAHRKSALEGTQPALRQSPPASSPDIMQLFAPRRAACTGAR
mmetsp:Transcript_39739/g.85684  ORF Transcript_39739/g.85684 Transcript_39739/m.85684 type:complete len:264 (-) Transcript_39739:472-1263(-)